MDMQHLLFGFTGRLNRARWWLTVIVVGIVYLIGAFIIGVISAAIGDFRGDQLGPIGWTLFGAWYAVYVYVGLALTVKRLHDRDKSGWWALLPYGLSVLLEIGSRTGLLVDVMGTMPELTPLGIILLLISAIVGIWFLIWLGFLRGTRGPNRFGPDPLGGDAQEVN